MTNTCGLPARSLAALGGPAGRQTLPQDPYDFALVLGGPLYQIVLAQRYVRELDDKWLRGGAPAGEPLVGSADIQSLADLGNSFELIRSMSVVPFTRHTVLQLGVITLLPVAPLLLTMVSLEGLVKQLLQVVL